MKQAPYNHFMCSVRLKGSFFWCEADGKSDKMNRLFPGVQMFLWDLSNK